ncbi:hypothetical protein EAF00_003082 [Botryotinia globosa]|nr:hypothetical protein EAF00_003082 [Botryotinia globosa]
MALEEQSSVSFFMRRAELLSSMLQLPDSGDGVDKTTNGLIDSLQVQVTNVLQRNSNEIAKFTVIENREKRIYLTEDSPQAQFVISQTRYLLDNFAVFRQIFARKASDPDFDSLNTIACEFSTIKAQKLIKERHIYLEELMRCDLMTRSDGYEAIKRLEPATIIIHLRYWHTWLSRKNFPDLSDDELQISLTVANAFGADLPLIEVAAKESGLQMLIDDTGESGKGNHKKASGKRKRSIGEGCESVASDLSTRSTEKIIKNPRREAPKAISESQTDESLSVIENAVVQLELPPPIGAIEGLNFVVILKTDLPTNQQEELSVENWGKTYTPEYIRCFKTNLLSSAPRLHYFFNARQTGSGESVDDSGVPVSDGHVWDPIQSDIKKPHSRFPILYYDEVISDFGESWDGWKELDPWIQGKTGQDVLWLAVQFWLLFTERNGAGDPPQRTREEMALKEDLVWAVGKWLGADYKILRRFHVSWGTKMKSDDPNNKTRETTHGFKGPGYFKNKRGPNDPLRFGK